ncbi:MAG: HEPN domain-containing protein [bacterium]|nr:HEPN domain-containing protein [bacterium]
MKEETRQWLDYAGQDAQSARILLQSHLYNPSLYHIQQAIEKCLKAIIVEHDLAFQRTHSIRGLVNIVIQSGTTVEIEEDDIDLIDSIYMPARYPLGSALPAFDPDQAICEQCLRIVDDMRIWADNILRGPEEDDAPEEND